MTESYLDISRSVLISSPAGSGKTEKLARRYIALLKSGSDVERILAITFTDKAAAEMKERILGILEAEDPEMFALIREKMPKMRISTIHSFCLKLLKRFCLDLGIDPSIEVMDSFNSDVLWSEAIYESLLDDGLSGERLFYGLIRDSGVKGWDRLCRVLDEFHSRRPMVELGIGKAVYTDIAGDDAASRSRVEKLVALYSKCLGCYRRKKFERHAIDYNDLELAAYETISKNPEWQNVLFSFDEHTDHILVDEFQDTSSLQWKIIDKLTEEWRSGIGSKRASGMKPTLFLVGDDKQSIYSFRGAEVSIFRNARNKLAEWLGEEYHFFEARENYRSLPAIVNFVNALFEKLMPKGLFDDLKIEYTPFEATRGGEAGEGNVELFIIAGDDIIKEERRKEASHMARKIKELNGIHEIYDGRAMRACGFGDMAVLLRSRTHLAVFEEALMKEDIPFIVVKGIGFYHTPEVSVLKNLLFFLIDPRDDYSLFNILRSPVFSVDYPSIFEIVRGTVDDETSSRSLYEALKARCGDKAGEGPFQGSLWGKDSSAEEKRFQGVADSLAGWLKKSMDLPYSVVLEEILIDSEAWRYFHERQRYLNVKKFIAIVEEFESRGMSGLEIREKLIKASSRTDEPKANVNTEGMDAVKIMTIHASKGLQFPMVFLPCLDEEKRAQSGSVAIEEDGEGIIIGYEDDPEMRKIMHIFRKQKEKAAEEEKRLFYVAATRAMDYLCMSGVSKKGKLTGKLSYLSEAFDILPGSQEEAPKLFNVTRVYPRQTASQADISGRPRSVRILPDRDEIIFMEPIDKDYRPSTAWSDVTEEVDFIRRRHGEDWVVLGRAFHRLFEGISKAIIPPEMIEEKTLAILRNETMSDEAATAMRKIILNDIQRLEREGRMIKIIHQAENSYSELPFVIQRGNKIYRGRIDRIILEGDTAYIYDYKTYPVPEAEITELSEKYSFQMNIYREAVEKLFSVRSRAFLFFTHEARLVEV